MAVRKKFQVFVSSTYLDLQSERQAAVQAILEAGHIPAGMELFGSGDESQKDVIKRWIDESDIYMLILGNRYGSLQPGSKKSYTQWEYEYAVSKKMPYFAIVISDEASLRRKVEHDLVKEWRAFRKLVTSRVVEFWNDERDIQIKIFKKLGTYTFENKLVGWVPGNSVVDTDQMASELTRLSKENEELRTKLAARSKVLSNKFTFAEMLSLLVKTPIFRIDDEIDNLLNSIAASFGRSERSLLDYFIFLGIQIQQNRRMYVSAEFPGLNTLVSYRLVEQYTEGTHFIDGWYGDVPVTLSNAGREFLMNLDIHQFAEPGVTYEKALITHLVKAHEDADEVRKAEKKKPARKKSSHGSEEV
jgi:hypothetical protein